MLNRVGSGEFQGGHPKGARQPSSQNCIYRGVAERKEIGRPQGTLGTLGLETWVEGSPRYSWLIAERVLESTAAPSWCKNSHGHRSGLVGHE